MRAMLAAAILVMAGGRVATAGPLEPLVLPPPAAPSKAVAPYVKVSAQRVALVHVRVIDGSGGPARLDQTVVIAGGRIESVGPGPAPAGAEAHDLAGYTVIPGLVGLHDHLYYIARPDLDASGRSEPPLIVPQMTFSAPRLYLANGVTTLRTTGSVEPYVDINLKHAIDAGMLPGPHMDVTGPYLEGAGSPFIQMHPLKDAEDARRTVEFWADQGATSFKAYMNITRAELGAAIETAHRRGLKVTGHLCSVTYPEAIALGIDDLEHGFWVNTQLDPGKTPDVCPPTQGAPTEHAMEPTGAAAAALFKALIDHHVAVTSTLPVFEPQLPGYAPLGPKMLAVLSPEARQDVYYVRNLLNNRSQKGRETEIFEFQRELALERAFAAAGGLLLAGPDPTGSGDVIPGFGDLREVELLVEAGFTPVEAVRIATLNGATYLGLDRRIGTVEAGKDADLVVIKGDPSTRIADIENVEIVFKDGVGFDAAALLTSVAGRYGQY
jgi:imidazolonepropionase-like amidohydrolase